MKEIQSNLSWDAYFLKHVYLAASKSKDPRTKIGAILVRDGVIISEGYNGFPRGVKDYEDRYIDRPTKYLYVVHAEDNAVLNAARIGTCTNKTTCYTQGIPCNECAKSLINAGIKEIIVHKQWPSMVQKWKDAAKITKTMCDEAGVKIRIFNQKLGVDAYSDGQILPV